MHVLSSKFLKVKYLGTMSQIPIKVCVLKFYTRLTNDKTGYFNRDSNKINVFPYHFDARNWMCGKI